MPKQLIGLAVILLASAPTSAADPPAKKVPASDDEIKKFIDELTKVDEPDMGYSPSLSGTAFLPLGRSETGTIHFGQRPHTRSDTLRQLVKLGAAAVPLLLEHLTDGRATKMVVTHPGAFGAMVVGADDQKDDPPAPPGGKDDPATGTGTRYTVTVADLCYVALGQIVNRPYTAVEYQPTAFIFVTAVARSKRVRDETSRDWKGLTPDRHLQSLTRDLLDSSSGELRNGASVRLAYYYPDDLEAVALKQLAKPFYPIMPTWSVVRKELYLAKTVQERKTRFDAFVAKHGEIGRE